MAKGSCLKRILSGLAVAVALLVITVIILIKVNSKPLPRGQAGAAADALAREMMAAIGDDAWQTTGAIQWNFDDRQQHLWDRKRHLARVRWGDMEVLIDLNNRQGRVYRNGKLVTENTRDYLEQAWAHWANDSFWLNPVSKLFDEGAGRALVAMEDGLRGLLVTYDSGGVTPGDSYLWVVDQSGLPIRWEMWVSIIPIGGLEGTWEDWTEINKVKFSQKHDLGIFVLNMTDLASASTAAELEGGKDPFAPLFAN